MWPNMGHCWLHLYGASRPGAACRVSRHSQIAAMSATVVYAEIWLRVKTLAYELMPEIIPELEGIG